MSTAVTLPSEFVESLCGLRFPEQTDRRLQQLMDRNTEGTLTPQERFDLEAMVELSERMSLIRARALQALDRRQ